MLVDDSTDIEKISLISTGSTTHAQASELKYSDQDASNIDILDTTKRTFWNTFYYGCMW